MVGNFPQWEKKSLPLHGSFSTAAPVLYEGIYLPLFSQWAVYSQHSGSHTVLYKWVWKHVHCTEYTYMGESTGWEETGTAEMSSWYQANRRQNWGLVWRNRKKISQIIKDYFHLPFFLLIILWFISWSNPFNITPPPPSQKETCGSKKTWLCRRSSENVL